MDLPINLSTHSWELPRDATWEQDVTRLFSQWLELWFDGRPHLRPDDAESGGMLEFPALTLNRGAFYESLPVLYRSPVEVVIGNDWVRTPSFYGPRPDVDVIPVGDEEWVMRRLRCGFYFRLHRIGDGERELVRAVAPLVRGLLAQSSTHVLLNRAGIGDIAVTHLWPQHRETPWGISLCFDCTCLAVREPVTDG